LADAFRQGLRECGYMEGETIAVEYRWAEGRHDWLPDLAAELAQLKVDSLVTAGTQTSRAAKQATSTIPIVMAHVGDPVGSGLVASLARPGGNITGVSVFGHEMAVKQLELLKQVVPRASQVAVLMNPTNTGSGASWRALQLAAP
jgi:putative ABC transport system substrate-binding protein